MSLIKTFKTVLCSFFGVRNQKNHEQDSVELNPVHVIIAGVFTAAAFVVLLMVIVRIVVS